MCTFFYIHFYGLSFNNKIIDCLDENVLLFFRCFFNFSRSMESLRDRYKRFLSKMTVKDWAQILEHIKKEGFLGCLKFMGSKNDKKFAGIDSSNMKHGKM